MALNKATSAAPKTAPGAFEQDGAETVVADKANAAIADALAGAAAAKAGVAATSEVARISANAVTAPAPRLTGTLFDELKNALPSMEFGVLPRLVGSNGQVMDGDKKLMGDTITVEVVSFNDNYVVSPGSDEETAKKHVRYSKDGVTIDETGENVNAYLETLRSEHDFPKANVKQYTELIAILHKSGKPSDHEGGMVQISLSPSSRKLFEGFRIQQTVKIRMGLAKASSVIAISTEVKTQNSNTFTVLKPGVSDFVPQTVAA